MIRAGRFSWQQALDRLRRADLARLRTPLPEYEHQGVLAALELSVEALPDKERGAFLDCAVFPEDVAIPEATLEVLWSGAFPTRSTPTMLPNSWSTASCCAATKSAATASTTSTTTICGRAPRTRRACMRS